MIFFNGGTAVGTIVSSGGVMNVENSGASSNTTVLSGGRELIYALPNQGSGGVATDETVFSGGTEVVSVGGVASETTVSQGGAIRISSGGLAVGTHVQSGGLDTIFRNGRASGTVIAGAIEYDFGSTFGTVVRAGGHEPVEGGATASGSLISSGGHEGVASGGFAVAATVYNGGAFVISSGGIVSSGLTIHAGSATIDGTMAAGQTVSFAGTAGDLTLDNLSAFGAAISGFGGASEKIDLGGFASGASETAKWSQTGTSGTLTVHDGAKIASLTLIGTYATGDFQLSTDGHGGTLIKDPTAPAAVPATRFTQALGGMEGGRFAASAAAVHDGESALIGASPLVGVATSGR